MQDGFKQISGCTKLKNGFSKKLFYDYKKIIAKPSFFLKTKFLWGHSEAQ